LDAPIEALSGISSADAERLQAAFGIRTIRALGESRNIRVAAAILGASVLNHDPGPPPGWAEFFQAAPIDYYVNHPAGRFRLDFGPVYYRGRLDGSARVLVVGQDPSTNEILAHRILVGTSGQRVQNLLARAGITRSYIMLNAFLFSVFGQFDSKLEKISEEPVIEGFRNAFLDRIADHNPIQAVVTFGRGARHGFERWPGSSSLPVFHATHPAAEEADVIANWNQLLPALHAAVTPDEGAPAEVQLYGETFTKDDFTTIPRFDLPFGMPDWHGRGGGHSTRDGDDKIVWNAP
jgi:hypothetical protein